MKISQGTTRELRKSQSKRKKVPRSERSILRSLNLPRNLLNSCLIRMWLIKLKLIHNRRIRTRNKIRRSGNESVQLLFWKWKQRSYLIWNKITSYSHLNLPNNNNIPNIQLIATKISRKRLVNTLLTQQLSVKSEHLVPKSNQVACLTRISTVCSQVWVKKMTKIHLIPQKCFVLKPLTARAVSSNQVQAILGIAIFSCRMIQQALSSVIHSDKAFLTRLRRRSQIW